MSESSRTDGRENADTVRRISDTEFQQRKPRDQNDNRDAYGSRFLTFWTTIPGMLTGLAGVITAIVALIALFHEPPKSTSVIMPSSPAEPPKSTPVFTQSSLAESIADI